MRISASQYAKTLVELSKGGPADVSVLAESFLLVLRRRRDVRKWPTILRMFGRMTDADAGRLSLCAETAGEPSEASRAALESLAREAFPGKELCIRYEIRPELLGGMRLSSDDEMLDATVRTRMRELEKRMKN